MNRENIGSIFLLIFSLVVCLYSIRLGIGSAHNPGTGFMPLISGVFFGFFSLLQLIFSWKLKRNMDENDIKKKKKKPKIESKIILVITSLLAYGVIMPKLGYLITTFLFMIALFRIGKLMKWWVIFGSSLLVTLSTYLIFDRWLSCRFPLGIIGYLR